MKLLFIVQGEGRGHLTQAVSMWEQLKNSKYEVMACLIGKETDENTKGFLKAQIHSPVHFFTSPNLVYNQSGKGLSVWSTVHKNTEMLPQYVKSLKMISTWVKKYEPDLIINFYDFLAGLYQVTYPRSAPPMVCVGHQYLMLHKHFRFPAGKNRLDRFLVNFNTRITGLRAQKMLVLSFSPLRSKIR